MKTVLFLVCSLTATSAMATFNIHCHDKKTKSHLHLEQGYEGEFYLQRDNVLLDPSTYKLSFHQNYLQLRLPKARKTIFISGDFGLNAKLEYVESKTGYYGDGAVNPNVTCSSLWTAD